MEYKITKLKINDIKNLDKIYKYLEDNPKCLRSSFRHVEKSGDNHSIKIGATKQRGARSSFAGIVPYRNVQKISILSMNHPKLDELLLYFLHNHRPDFKFNSVLINKNCQAEPHIDSKNIGNSIIITIGDFSGGGIYVEENIFQPRLFEIRTYSLEFNGSFYKHWTEPFKGNRYSLIFF